MATDATLTSKGRTTIPKEIRDSLGMKPGDQMTFTLMPAAFATEPGNFYPPHNRLVAGSSPAGPTTFP